METYSTEQLTVELARQRRAGYLGTPQSSQSAQRDSGSEQALLDAIRAEVTNDPARIRQQQQDEIEAQEFYRTYYLDQVFRTVIPGRGVPVRNLAAEAIVISWLHPGETLTREWFRGVLAAQPELANQIPWQSADVLDPTKRKQAEAAQLAKDQITFSDAARALRSFGVNMANFNVIRQVLGEGFSQYDIQNALASNAFQLAPPGQEELTQWATEDIENHNQRLLQADDVTLRAAVKQESAARKQAVQHEQAARQLEAAQQRDALMGFPPLPSDITSDRIRAASPSELKLWMKKYGNYQLNARLAGREN